MTRPSQIRKDDKVTIPAIITGTVLRVHPGIAGATILDVHDPDHGNVRITVPEDHDITLQQITLRENT